MKKSIFASGAFMIALLVAASGCGGADNKKNVVHQAPKPVVKTTTAELRMVDSKSEFTGTIQPLAENNISPSMGLRIDRIEVEAGDRVRKGQLLVSMDKSQYLQAATQLANLQTDLARTEALYAEGGVSKQQVDQLATQVQVTKLSVENLKENTELRSPINGIVAERLYDPGDIYSPSTGRILTVMQIDRVKVKVNVSESHFAQVKTGMPVEVKLDTYPDKVFEGKVTLIYPSIDPATHSFATEITIQNPDMTIRPGMYARVILNFGRAERVVIPDVAVQKQVGTNERYIFVIQDSVAVRRPVVTGQVVGQSYEIISGVSAGEQVVVAGAQKLLDKSVVEVSK